MLYLPECSPPSETPDAPNVTADADADDDADVSLARARKARRNSMEPHVVEIAGMMAAGEWVAGTSHESLAARDGVTVDAVKKWATTAGRMLRLLESPRMAALRARNVQRLDDVYEDAGDAEDHKARVSAIAEQNKMLGLVVQRHEVSASSVTAAEWDAWRSAVASELCAGCKERLLARVRQAKDPSE